MEIYPAKYNEIYKAMVLYKISKSEYTEQAPAVNYVTQTDYHALETKAKAAIVEIRKAMKTIDNEKAIAEGDPGISDFSDIYHSLMKALQDLEDGTN